jgi:glutamate-1-semialdehyde 2,1-aminomutase
MTPAAAARSRALFAEAVRHFPGGVNSPVRAFKSVGGNPVFIASARGSRIVDADGQEYVDYVGSWGALILGHADPGVVAALRKAVDAGTSYGAPTELEVQLARLVKSAVPSLERMRFVSSGTEACMSALRLARGVTGRDLLVKFEGCYHGHADALLVKAGSGGLTFGVPDSAGVPAALARLTCTLPYNDLDAAAALFRQRGGEVAAVIVEPVAGNMGVVPPAPGFLAGLRELTHRHGALLIFDEVITGFRVGWGGAQAMYAIRPDLTCLGKIVGGGLPMALYGGRAEVMDRLAPEGPVYQAGTLSGNPLAMTAGIETLARLQPPGPYADLERLGAQAAAGLAEAAGRAGQPVTVNRAGSMLTLFFGRAPVHDMASARAADTARYGAFFRAMLERGVHLAPSQFEAAFISTAHTAADLDLTLAAAQEAFAAVASEVPE